MLQNPKLLQCDNSAQSFRTSPTFRIGTLNLYSKRKDSNLKRQWTQLFQTLTINSTCGGLNGNGPYGSYI